VHLCCVFWGKGFAERKGMWGANGEGNFLEVREVGFSRTARKNAGGKRGGTKKRERKKTERV